MSVKRRRGPRKGPRFLKTHETHWIGDDCIDRAASDVERWCEAADKGAIVTLAGKPDPDIVKWRALTDQEWDQLPITMSDAPEEWIKVLAAQSYAAVRMGLISFGDWTLAREEYNGVQRLTKGALFELCEDIEDEEIPVGLATRALLRAQNIQVENTEEPEGMRPTSFVQWIGAHILRESFLRRRRGKA